MTWLGTLPGGKGSEYFFDGESGFNLPWWTYATIAATGGLAGFAFGPAIPVGRTVTVCRYGSPITSGSWVMVGNPTWRNWLFSGLPQYGIRSRVYIQNSQVLELPREMLRYPSGWEWWKGLIGQRIVR